MFNIQWLRDATERALKSAAQAVVLALGASQGFNLFAADWQNVAGIAAGAAVLSVLTSVISAPLGAKGSASLLSGK
jgi:hypothetical protein